MKSHLKVNTNTQEMTLRRYRSHKNTPSNSQFFLNDHFGSELLGRHGSVCKSRSKSKFVERRLFASARKIDNRLTLLKKSSLSGESGRNSQKISGLTRSGSKQSFKSSNRLSINNVVSEMVGGNERETRTELSFLIETNTVVVVDGRVEMGFGLSEISGREEEVLRLYSEIEEMDEEIEMSKR